MMASFGALGAPPSIPGGMHGLMRCPRCGDNTQDAWKPLQTMEAPRKDRFGEISPGELFERSVPLGDNDYAYLTLDWMRCEGEECLQTVIRVHETTVLDGYPPSQVTNTRFLYPTISGSRAPAPLGVPEDMQRDYNEAGAILDHSHRMSAVLARKIVGDLLKRYAGRDEKRLTSQIEHYIAQPGVPGWLSSGLHHVREAADMAAHTQEEDGAEELIVIDIDSEEAEWTLDFVERMFDHFIIAPAKDEAIKSRIEAKSSRAGRRPFGKRGNSDGGEAT